MIREDDLQAAVAEGIIDRAQAIRIAHLARTRLEAIPAPGPEWSAAEPRPLDPDDEHFRLIGGFNDVFVGIGVCLLAGALLGLSSVIGFGHAFSSVALLSAWILSEIFARRMRLALPSILLAAMFAGAAGLFAGLIIFPQPLQAGPYSLSTGYNVLAFSTAFGLAAALHHWRFRVPFDSALVAGGGVGVVLALISTVAPALMRDHLNLILLACGLCVFALALNLDTRDPHRLTRRSDAAFWLHLLSAGLIVHPTFRSMVGQAGGMGMAQSLAILGLFLALGVIALVIDRRALLVSALSYAGIAVAYLIAQSVSTSLSLPLALLGLAVMVLALSAGWRGLRRALLSALPLERWHHLLPPIDARAA